jgi:hypothetical protein
MRVTVSCPTCEHDLDAEVLPTSTTWVPYGSAIVALPGACEVDLPDACPNSCIWTTEDRDALMDQAIAIAEESDQEAEEPEDEP